MEKEPLVMCMTNSVASNFTANVLLAVGAKPAMIEEPSEAAELAACANAVLVNVGTVTPAQAEAMRAAIAVCRARLVPWVLDPVACHVLAYRRALVGEFLKAAPSLVRGNQTEITHLEQTYSGFREGFTTLATGETDIVRSGNAQIEIAGGVPMLQAITATGCAQGALCAAYLGWGKTPYEACVSASKLMKQAGERAWATAQTPGRFKVALVDALWELTHD